MNLGHLFCYCLSRIEGLACAIVQVAANIIAANKIDWICTTIEECDARPGIVAPKLGTKKSIVNNQ